MKRRQFGSIRKLPSGKWQARYRGGDGRMVSAPDTFSTKTDASLWLAGVETDQHRGSFLDPKAGRITVEAWSNEWLRTKRGQRPATLAHDRAALAYALPVIGASRVSAVKPLDVRRAVEAMQDAGLKPASVAGYVNVLASLFAAAVEAELIARSPVKRKLLSLAEPAKVERPHLTPAELHLLAASVPERFSALVLVMGALGLRWGEAIALRPAAIDTLRRLLTVDRVVEEVGGHLAVVQATKSDAGRRTIAVPQFVVDAVAAHLATHRAGLDRGGLMFVGERGGTLRRNWRARTFAPAVKAAKLPPTLTVHGLRHVAATYLEEVNAPLRVRQHRLGHAPQGITMGVYTHVPPALDQAVAADLDELLRDPQTANSGTHVARKRVDRRR